MRTSITSSGILVTAALFGAAVATAEAPEVEARLEEAASAGAALERVLEERRPTGRGMASRPEPSRGERATEEAAASDGKPAMEMHGMGKMRGGGMGGMDAAPPAAGPATAGEPMPDADRSTP